MRTRTWILIGILAVPCLQLGGCLQQLRIPVEFGLGGALGIFAVEAGVPTQNRGTGELGNSEIQPGSGSININPDNITVTPSNTSGGKGTVNFQGGTLTITAWIAAVDAIDTVCETGEEYGPFSVELNEANQPVSVDPSSITLSQSTIDLINGGQFSLCIEVVSPIDGTVTIDALSFNLGL